METRPQRQWCTLSLSTSTCSQSRGSPSLHTGEAILKGLSDESDRVLLHNYISSVFSPNNCSQSKGAKTLHKELEDYRDISKIMQVMRSFNLNLLLVQWLPTFQCPSLHGKWKKLKGHKGKREFVNCKVMVYLSSLLFTVRTGMQTGSLNRKDRLTAHLHAHLLSVQGALSFLFRRFKYFTIFGCFDKGESDVLQPYTTIQAQWDLIKGILYFTVLWIQNVFSDSDPTFLLVSDPYPNPI